MTDIGWTIRDEQALEAKAYSAALMKARRLAQQMATELKAGLGDLLYASNTTPRPVYSLAMAATTTSTIAKGEPKLKLFPQKVEEEATVHAVFSIQ